MKELKDKLGNAEPELVHKRFDILAGTSTGGLLSILLGQLRVPADNAYDILRNVLPKDALRDLKSKIFGKHVDERVRSVVEKYWSSPEAILYEEVPRGLIVTSNQTPADAEIAHFQNSARVGIASSAERRQSGLEDVDVDGGIGRNNPTKWMIKESRRKYGPVRFRLLLSIGSGLDANSAAIHEDVSNDFKAFDLGCYVRVEIPGLAEFRVDDRNAIPKIKKATSTFLRSVEGERFLASVVDVLEP